MVNWVPIALLGGSAVLLSILGLIRHSVYSRVFARVHSMAYANEMETLNVRTNDGRIQFYFPGSDPGVPRVVKEPESAEAQTEGLEHLISAIDLYEQAIRLLKKSTNSPASKAWLVLPLELGHAWCLDQAGEREKALKWIETSIGRGYPVGEITRDPFMQKLKEDERFAQFLEGRDE